MSQSRPSDVENSLILSTVAGFHEYFSSPPPFIEGSKYTIPDALSVVPLPPNLGGLKIETFADMYERVGGLLAKQYEVGTKSFKHQLTEPKAEVWMSGNIAAVLVGWSASIDDRENFVHTLHLCTLHRLQGQDSATNPWRISGLIDMQHLPPDVPMPDIETGPLTEIVGLFETLRARIEAQVWEPIVSMLLPGAGATVSQVAQPPKTFMWSEWIGKLQASANSDILPQRRIHNFEARRCMDLAFVWAPFVIETEGHEQGRGVSVASFRQEGGQWLISGLQESSWS
ncbi:hypothetical protein FVEN_g8126 [Fusarium venenatum]|uniref:Uncharacterized protein n=1 Tax=Fusarium venenatum TaxID=56646 RepID=A0A2L2SSH3_9HYPO|nr:uncharacterized protein FVRRES_04520 [Fusarium venenatum]KAG8353864.1 hypothetical protein FVEN_g8126 [Fusarium venenatum]KAH6991681.1 hypothetical protein EDB82DRAFT_494363 [Fusarium venenatum]CEI60084.1 unnamed protein product [Fusarium venenatum]